MMNESRGTMPVRVKICGITNERDAFAAVDAGADAVGFVFAKGPRAVTPEAARRISRKLPAFVHRVGVFVDAPASDVHLLARAHRPVDQGLPRRRRARP